MKLLLATLLCLFTYTSAHAQPTWPRNLKTGKVEFRGSLPWPASAKTEAQRRALVRRWYLAKLTNSTKEQIEKYASAEIGAALTYAGLPVTTVMRSDLVSNNTTITLFYYVNLNPTGKSLAIKLSGFDFSRATDESTASASDLESLLAADYAGDHAALTILRTRLAAAVASW